MMTNPSLMFFIDVPQVCVSWMLVNLYAKVDVLKDGTDGLEHRLFTSVAPVKAPHDGQGQQPHLVQPLADAAQQDGGLRFTGAFTL